uniref:RING-type domain-containing protein n=1 Tax=Steinernema glaseri TaxID=37863 RepID=A0A1I7ZJS0_9BILA
MDQERDRLRSFLGKSPLFLKSNVLYANRPISSLNCHYCQTIFYQPIVPRCGHSICHRCRILASRRQDNSTCSYPGCGPGTLQAGIQKEAVLDNNGVPNESKSGSSSQLQQHAQRTTQFPSVDS